MADPVPTPRRREQTKQETRRALIEAARRSFAEQGLWEPSLDAICERAGFTRGAFYVHFRSREDLMAAVMEQTLGELVDGLIGSEGAGNELETSIDRYVAVASLLRQAPLRRRRIPFHQLLEVCQRSPRIGELLARILQDAGRRLAEAARRAQARGVATGEIRAEEHATLLLLLSLGVLVAEELALPIDLGASRDALRRLIAPA